VTGRAVKTFIFKGRVIDQIIQKVGEAIPASERGKTGKTETEKEFSRVYFGMR
jgi:hypothetical protein